MKKCRANYSFEYAGPARVVIRDIGPWDEHPSVTNDVEAVVQELVAEGHLREGQQLYYFDSDGQLDEILVKDGRFLGFAPGPADGRFER
ncbi:MAG: hypothetical protein ABFD52_08945 [Acidobacteriota bacterium]